MKFYELTGWEWHLTTLNFILFWFLVWLNIIYQILIYHLYFIASRSLLFIWCKWLQKPFWTLCFTDVSRGRSTCPLLWSHCSLASLLSLDRQLGKASSCRSAARVAVSSLGWGNSMETLSHWVWDGSWEELDLWKWICQSQVLPSQVNLENNRYEKICAPQRTICLTLHP